MTDNIIIIITTPDKDSAIIISERVVSKGLVACAQVNGPITSIYNWNDELQKDNEWRLLLKTKASFYEKVEHLVVSIHPYDTPQIVAIPIIKGFEPYLDWIDKSVIK